MRSGLMSSRSCVFCQLPLMERSKEHVLPQWLLDHLEIRDEKVNPTHFKADATVVSSRRHTLDNLVEGSICADCNSKWMSQLEEEAKPILVPLMAGEREVIQLSADERLVLARWTCKTAYVLNSSSNYEPKVPAAHFRHVRENVTSLPQFVAAVAQQHHGNSKFYWVQQQFLMTSDFHPYFGTLEEARTLIAPSYKISLLLKKLILLIAYWPWEKWRMVLWPRIHIPLWPNRGPVGWYPQNPIPGGFPWFDSVEAINAFHVTLGLIREDRAIPAPQFGL